MYTPRFYTTTYQQEFEHQPDVQDTPYKIAIIGGGPKGMYGLERLLAVVNNIDKGLQVDIHIFNNNKYFGAGAIYRHDQPEYLLMNYENGYINAWKKSGLPSVDRKNLSLTDWLLKHDGISSDKQPNAYSPRAVVGRYLSYCFDQLLTHKPDDVTITTHIGEIIGLRKTGSDYQLCLQSNDGEKWLAHDFQELLIATGHRKPAQNSTADAVSDKRHIRFVYPVDEKLGIIPPLSKVAIKGLGLTFIDTVLALTEGRGGSFSEETNGTLIYHPSGNEPEKIYPYSRTGHPILPRKESYGLPERKLHFFHPAALENKMPPYDYQKDILPLIERELSTAYYDVLFKIYGHSLEIHSEYSKVTDQINAFHQRFPAEKRFSLSLLFSPFGQQTPEFHRVFMDYLNFITLEAEKGPEVSPIIAAAIHWKYLSPFFNEVYSFGGFSASGQKDFLENYSGNFNRISYGPPLINMKKILAIEKKNLIDFSFAQMPSVNHSKDSDHFKLVSSHGKEVSIDYMIDARIPKNNILQDSSLFYNSLIQQQIIRPLVNANTKNGEHPYELGSLEINKKGNPISADGKPISNITFTGTPTEGNTFDNDTLSRDRNDLASDWAVRTGARITKYK